MSALCIGKWWLFDSTNPSDHLEAKALCMACPMRRECGQIAAKFQRAPDSRRSVLEGTWAGRLYGATAYSRRRLEDSMFTDEEAKLAHTAFHRVPAHERTRMILGDRILIGERVYQRRKKRAQKSRAAA